MTWRNEDGRVFDLGPAISEHYALLAHTLTTRKPTGVALEFGVATGESLRIIAAHMKAIGFDSFTGLPEDWRDGYPKGSFACPPPTIPNTRLVIGSFADTLSGFHFPDNIGLVHIDCDLHSSTETVLAHLGSHLKPGCCIVFDEFHGYDGAEDHEQRAWREYTDAFPDLNWTVIGHGHQAWSIQIA